MSTDAPKEAAPTPIMYEQLNSVPAVSTLGLIAATSLQRSGIVTLMVGPEGAIELVPEGELELDVCDEGDALRILIERSYTDDQLQAYLRQRETRLKRRTAQSSPIEGHR